MSRIGNKTITIPAGVEITVSAGNDDFLRGKGKYSKVRIPHTFKEIPFNYVDVKSYHMGKEIGKVIDYRDGHCLIRLFDNINQFDGIRIISKKGDTGKILNTLTVNKKMVSKAFKNEIINVKVDSPVLKGDMVVRTLDYNLENRINDYKLKKRPIDIKIKFKPNEDIEVYAKLDELEYKEIVNERPQEAKKAPISLSDLENVFSKMDNSPFVINKSKNTLILALSST